MKSAYIHIPFCNQICSYCDFPKVYYNNCFIDKYLNALSNEIKKYYKDEELDTIYIGGGTPSSLNVDELKKLLDSLSILKKSKDIEYTIECNLDSLTIDKLMIFKEYGINRLSIGVQTFNESLLKYLNRNKANIDIIKKAKDLGFNNINIDLIYAIPGETLDDLKNDLNEFIKLDIKHISTYSLIIEPNTLLGINNTKSIDEELDLKMYEYICDYLKKHGFNHYEISNFSLPGYESKHNLKYWNNEHYYGFGMGASSYIENKRITNTKSITKYLNNNYRYDEEVIDKKSDMEYEMILGLRKIKGVNMSYFKDKYGFDIEEIFDIKKLLEEGKLIKENNYLKINEKYIYLSNDILINFIGD